jgi:hypothetical protein
MTTPLFGPIPVSLGSQIIVNAANLAPTAPTAGWDTNRLRFVNLYLHLTGAAGVTAAVTVWIYHPIAGWFLYTDVPQTTLLLANNGGFFQLELRGVERVYVQVNTITAGATLTMRAEGVSYSD